MLEAVVDFINMPYARMFVPLMFGMVIAFVAIRKATKLIPVREDDDDWLNARHFKRQPPPPPNNDWDV